MGKRQQAAQTTTPQQDVEAPTAASGELTGLQAELMRAQQLAGAGNAYVQDQLNQQAAASVETVQAATAEAVEVTQSPEAEVADVEQAIEEVEVAVEGAEEGGGITGDAPPSDPGGSAEETAAHEATGTEETVVGESSSAEAAATEAPAFEEAVATEAPAPAPAETNAEAPDARTQVKKEFEQVWKTTSAAETDAWLDALQAREATEPALAGLAAELRALTQERRAALAAKEPAAPATTAPAATTATQAAPAPVMPPAEVEEPGGLWGIWAGIKDVMSAAKDTLSGLFDSVVSGMQAWFREDAVGADAASPAEPEQEEGRWTWLPEDALATWDLVADWWHGDDMDEGSRLQAEAAAHGGRATTADPEEGQGSPLTAEEKATMLCTSAQATLRDDTLKPLEPPATIPNGSYVRLLEQKVVDGKAYGKVASAKSARGPAGKTLGWTLLTNLKALPARPARPSDPASQMSALLAATTTSAKPSGYCYRKIKKSITAAGGYGDILDIYQDERFVGFGNSAVDFTKAVDRLGPEAFDLKSVPGLPADAPAGTLMVIQGNGKQRLSTVHGDINVIAGVQGGKARDEVRKVSSGKAILRDEKMQPVQPEALIGQNTFVWVLEEREVDGTRFVRVAEADGQMAEEHGEMLGWTSASNLVSGGGTTPLIKCYNDGVMYLPADANTWTSGNYQGVLLGLYQPVTRR